MPDEPPPHPYRTPWEPAARVLNPSEGKTPWAVRRELLRVRALVDQRNLPDLDALVLTIMRLTETRDWIRGWSRPARGLLLTIAAALITVALAVIKEPGGRIGAGFAVCLALIAAAVAEFWANQWFDLVAEYDGLITDLRKAVEKTASSAAQDWIIMPVVARDDGELRGVASQVALGFLSDGYRIHVEEHLGEVVITREKGVVRERFRVVPTARGTEPGEPEHHIGPAERVRVADDAVGGDTASDPSGNPLSGQKKRASK